tara:strand:+ start:770 stop:1000 length:231 start_codon:yes stop_codon:yes gene_type:complete
VDSVIEDDDDIIQGLGHVTYHAAHLEGWIDELLYHFNALKDYSDKEKKYPISRKIKKAKNILTSLDSPLPMRFVRT